MAFSSSAAHLGLKMPHMQGLNRRSAAFSAVNSPLLTLVAVSSISYLLLHQPFTGPDLVIHYLLFQQVINLVRNGLGWENLLRWVPFLGSGRFAFNGVDGHVVPLRPGRIGNDVSPN
jgi:hypothetical protein